MADLRFRQTFSAVSCTAATVKTVAQVKAPTNQRVVIREISISFQGTTNTDAPALVQLLRQTTAGTMTAGTPVAVDDDNTETIQSTTQYNATVEPTAGNILAEWYVHQQTGIIVPLSTIKPICIKGGGRIGLRVTAGATVSSAGYLECEE